MSNEIMRAQTEFVNMVGQRYQQLVYLKYSAGKWYASCHEYISDGCDLPSDAVIQVMDLAIWGIAKHCDDPKDIPRRLYAMRDLKREARKATAPRCS